MIVSKLVGLYLVNRIFDLGWSLTTNLEGMFSVQVVYPDAASAIFSNTYSNLFMIVCLLIGNIFLVFQGYYLHTSHQNPKVLVRLVKFDLVAWLTDTATLFPKIAAWLSFLWVAAILSVVQTVQLTNYIGVSVFAFVATIIITALDIRDFEHEVKTTFSENATLDVK